MMLPLSFRPRGEDGRGRRRSDQDHGLYVGVCFHRRLPLGKDASLLAQQAEFCGDLGAGFVVDSAVQAITARTSGI
jgi:hypothetical protein